MKELDNDIAKVTLTESGSTHTNFFTTREESRPVGRIFRL